MYFWISFADPDRPPGAQFLGAAIVDADSMRDALPRAYTWGCNPGGQATIVALGAWVSPEVPCHRLLGREEAETWQDKIPYHCERGPSTEGEAADGRGPSRNGSEGPVA